MGHVYILGGARTPFGSFGGVLKDVSAIDLGVIASKGAIEKVIFQLKRLSMFLLGM